MRILFISWEYPPNVVGGIGRHVSELVRAFIALSGENTPHFHLDLLTPHRGNALLYEELSDSVTIHRVETPSVNPLDLFNSVVDNNRYLVSKAKELHHDNPYTLIHVHDWLTASAGIELKHAWKIPLVTTIHATERGRHQSHLPSETSHNINQLEWQVCFESWRLIVCSSYMAGELRSFFDVPLDKVTLIPNGVDVTPFQSCSEERIRELKARFAPLGEKLLFYVGRITPEKGVQVLLQALTSIREKHPDVRLLVAGRNSEQLQPLVDELGIGDAVELLGFIDSEMRDCLYRSVDAAVFPSLYEPFGIVALEAMAAGCSVIASQVGGLSEVVDHRRTGLTVRVNDTQSIAWAVDQLFTDPVQARAMRARALQEVTRSYNWLTIGASTLNMYRAVVAQRQSVNW
ncbi:MAG: glycosyltransferase family 4 protein [Caldilineaceae bacterium]|nr:glycosyltransferase family 4 protein [Caldilineaceae bacterium]